MIGGLGLILAFLSVVALIDPRTPFGKSLLRIPYIKNDVLIKFYPKYKKILFYVTSIFIGLGIYLILSVVDFYLMQSFLMSFFYLGMTSSILLPFLLPRLFRKDKERFKILVKVLKPFVISFFGFMLLFILIASFMHYKIENGELNEVYQKCKANPVSEDLLKLSDSTVLDFKERYQKEIKIIANINMINQYKAKYNFDYDLSSQKDTSQAVCSSLINYTKRLYNINSYTDEFRERIKALESYSRQMKPKPLHLLPVEIQPYYVSSLVVAAQANHFASLAVGSKIYLLDIYNKAVKIIGLIGLIILIPFTALLSLWLTFKLARYNERSTDCPENSNNYFFMFVSVFGFLIAVISLF